MTAIGKHNQEQEGVKPLATDRAGRIGVLLAAIGSVSYGITVVVGEDLADAGLGPTTALGVRFGVGGLFLALLLRLRRVRVFPSRRIVLVGLGLGVLYATEATFFFSALERGTAAAVALVFSSIRRSSPWSS